jgi:hypothetical protein
VAGDPFTTLTTVAAALRRGDDGAMSSEARVLERPGGVSAQDRSKIAKRNQPTCPDTQDWVTKQVHEWLFLLLRFGITLDSADRAAVLALADEIDAVGLNWPSAPTFFRRTTSEVCKAIAALDDPKRAAILKRHIARIDNPALRRAFQAAVNLEERLTKPSNHNRRGLWSGLRR